MSDEGLFVSAPNPSQGSAFAPFQTGATQKS
jgi:hypothetical protein